MRFLESDHSDKVPLVHSNAFTRFMLLKKDTAWPNDVYRSGNRFVFFKKMLEQTKVMKMLSCERQRKAQQLRRAPCEGPNLA